jgi:DNA-binding transcriptional ArsR family regulator
VLKQSAALDLVYSALADPTRRAMIAQLVRGPASVSDLARPLKMSLPAVSQHLKVLEDSGLVASRKVGRVRTCRLDPRRLDAAQSWIAEQRSLWESRLDRMDELLLKGEKNNEQE